MSISRVVNRAELLEIDASNVSTSYVLIGVLPGPTRSVKIKSTLNGAFYLTYDTSKNQMWFPAPPLDGDGNAACGIGQVEDHTSNSPANGDVFDEPKGRPYYIKWDGSAPSNPTGKLVIECNTPQTGV